MKTIAITSAALVAFGGVALSVPTDSAAQSRVAPRGSYAQSCSGAYVNQGRLYADCRDMRGQMRGTSIELSRCSDSEIGNDDGRLVCGRHRGDIENGQGGGRPGGGWGGNNGGGWGRQSITVFRDSNYRGDSRTFNGEVEDLKQAGMNDVASSLRLRGRWEVCEHSYYRGRCEIVDYDVNDLVRMGLNDRISSLRPVRGGGGRY